ncbi:MAG: Fic/DOC family N-terminal domain-containing protein [Elusimicrobiota bacterium]|nr:Fic/DOC family N-terminal domain-containing protein [Elusimicrobiota bacterium]
MLPYNLIMTESMPGKSQRSGRWEKQPGLEPYYCFLPAPLPPNPPLKYNEKLLALTEKAGRALGRLDAIATNLPNPQILLYTYIRKEAALSSQIEGAQSSLSDLLLFETKETPGVPFGDAGGSELCGSPGVWD